MSCITPFLSSQRSVVLGACMAAKAALPARFPQRVHKLKGADFCGSITNLLSAFYGHYNPRQPNLRWSFAIQCPQCPHISCNYCIYFYFTNLPEKCPENIFLNFASVGGWLEVWECGDCQVSASRIVVISSVAGVVGVPFRTLHLGLYFRPSTVTPWSFRAQRSWEVASNCDHGEG